MMKARITLVFSAALTAVFVLSCTPTRSAQPSPLPQAASHGGRSVLLTDKELQEVVSQVLPGCARVALIRSKTREVLVGFAKDGDKSLALATLARVTDHKRKGSMVVAVGMKSDKGKDIITGVVTLPSKGKLHGAAKYAKGRAKFLKQFANRPVKVKLGKIDTVSGATHLSKQVKNIVKGALKVMRALKAKPDGLSKLAAKSWPVTPPVTKSP